DGSEGPERESRDDEERIPGSAWERPGMPKSQSPPHQLIREVDYGLAIDGGGIPLAHRRVLRGAFDVRRAVLEAVGVQEVGGGGEHVGHAVAQVDTAIAVEID